MVCLADVCNQGRHGTDRQNEILYIYIVYLIENSGKLHIIWFKYNVQFPSSFTDFKLLFCD